MSSLTLISVKEAAEILGITPRSVARRIEAGTLRPAMKLPGRTGAFLLSAVEVEALAEALRARHAS